MNLVLTSTAIGGVSQVWRKLCSDEGVSMGHLFLCRKYYMLKMSLLVCVTQWRFQQILTEMKDQCCAAYGTF